MHKDIESIYFTEEQIAEAVKALGKQITKDYAGKKPLLICILKGSVIFLADLIREIELDCRIDFMTVQSYHNSTVSSGVIEITKDVGTDIEGRDVILVEDILDSARTLNYVYNTLSERKPASMKICTLLDKKTTKVANIKADYKCFDIEDQFVVGYGLDYAQDYRALPYIGILKKEVYTK